mmetsp:Transcript_19087/g.27754  ORF Transcript_19087/g.27754 Transcript_19087/m.27754 type:complete len:126 (-) Transcript_19087:423-800(-)
MGKAKKTRKFAVTKKIISPKDTRIKSVSEQAKVKALEEQKKKEPKQVEQAVSSLFFSIQYTIGSTVSYFSRYELFELFDSKQTGCSTFHDGLPLGQMYPLHHRLCHGRARKTGPQIPRCIASRKR